MKLMVFKDFAQLIEIDNLYHNLIHLLINYLIRISFWRKFQGKIFNVVNFILANNAVCFKLIALLKQKLIK